MENLDSGGDTPSDKEHAEEDLSEFPDIFGGSDDEDYGEGVGRAMDVDRDGNEVVEIASIPKYKENAKLGYIRLPNFIGIDPREYNEHTLGHDFDEEGIPKFEDWEGVIRWRKKKASDGSMERESNASIVRWEDGTIGLYIGKEYYRMEEQEIREEEDRPMLFAMQKGGVIQCQGIFDTKLSILPSESSSKRARLRKRQAGIKERKVKRTADSEDPEAKKIRMERAISEKIRSNEKLQRTQKRLAQSRGYELSEAFLEDGMDDELSNDEADDSEKLRHLAEDATRIDEVPVEGPREENQLEDEAIAEAIHTGRSRLRSRVLDEDDEGEE